MPRLNSTQKYSALLISISYLSLLSTWLPSDLSTFGYVHHFGDQSLIKLHHYILSAVTITTTLFLFRKIRISIAHMMLITSLLLTSMFSYIFTGVNIQFVSFLYCIVVYFVADVLGSNLSHQQVVNALRGATYVYAALIVVKSIIYWDIISLFLNNLSGRIVDFVFPSIAGGGINIEASLMVASSVFFIRHRLFLPIWSFGLALAMLYGSRGSTLAALLVAAIFLLQKASPVRVGLYFAVALALAWTILQLNNDLYTYILHRFDIISLQDGGTSGRIALWKHGLDAFLQNPLGYGVLNGHTAAEKVSELQLSNDNLHNIYLQILLDGGIHTFLIWTCIAAFSVIQLFRSRFANEFHSFAIIYFFLGMIQFRGYDAFIYFILGLTCSLSANKKRNISCTVECNKEETDEQQSK